MDSRGPGRTPADGWGSSGRTCCSPQQLCDRWSTAGAIRIPAVGDIDDGHRVTVVVDAVDDPVGAAARAVPVLQRGRELLADPLRTVQQWAGDEFVRGRGDRLRQVLGGLA